jgi:hypothetical protein
MSEFNACACMGPMYGEPFCYCKMKLKGLQLNVPEREADHKQFTDALHAYLAKIAATKEQG